MRIGIDYTAGVRQRAGIGRYARNLVEALARMDRSNQYRLLVAGHHGKRSHRLGSWPSNFQIRSLPVSDRWMHILWQRLRLPVPVQLITGSLDLFHSPDFVLPPLAGRTAAILTVHDLSFLRVPQFFVPGFRSYLETSVARAVKRANHILADSESTKRDLLDLLSVDPEDVSVLYPGVEPRFAPVECPDELRRVRARYRLPDRFVLGLGTLQPRKNFDGLIAAFGQLVAGQDRHPEIAGLHLVIAGDEGWLYDDVFALVDRLRLDDRVLFSGFVDDADLPALYTLAAAFAFPSWYEGFGLPVLEAMACGTPVVAAQNSSLPEVIGQAGILVDAADQDALARSLFRLLTEPDLVRNLRDLGLRQSRQFTWEGAAAKLLKTYEALYSAAEIQHRS